MAIAAHEETVHGSGHAHPSDLQYVYVALFLGVVTGAEIVLGYRHPNALIIGSLLTLMVIKFATVALWFMHLRFDSLLFRRFFLTGILLAAGVYIAIMMTAFQFFGNDTTSVPLNKIPPPARITR
ncbi:MAG: cytochrome C oxidase subunit IV family protein [Acidobacteria bacterium]|nr:cytochrome C oxidase subunit IV family protein [Acidobacteriota bacterium]